MTTMLKRIDQAKAAAARADSVLGKKGLCVYVRTAMVDGAHGGPSFICIRVHQGMLRTLYDLQDRCENPGITTSTPRPPAMFDIQPAHWNMTCTAATFRFAGNVRQKDDFASDTVTTASFESWLRSDSKSLPATTARDPGETFRWVGGQLVYAEDGLDAFVATVLRHRPALQAEETRLQVELKMSAMTGRLAEVAGEGQTPVAGRRRRVAL